MGDVLGCEFHWVNERRDIDSKGCGAARLNLGIGAEERDELSQVDARDPKSVLAGLDEVQVDESSLSKDLRGRGGA